MAPPPSATTAATRLCGVDEAGRGPLAGAVFALDVVLMALVASCSDPAASAARLFMYAKLNLPSGLLIRTLLTLGSADTCCRYLAVFGSTSLKDKRRGPGWTYTEVRCGPAGLR